ncbi:MAG: SDR family NAD(P)-dependent oxidoreductase [Desulfobacterales bacterium]|nr:MAG: SDR family NAD(P)-dependent oxidoreductase [Desulfobacterales bacterium]
MSRTIALTGATGFIGSILASSLINAGWQIQALVRPTSDRSHLRATCVKWIEGNLEDLDSLRRLVRNVDAIVHCAGAVRGVSEKQFIQVNVEGVARLVHAAVEQHSLPRFLLISSLAAREPHLSPYATSKRQAEETLAAAAGDMFWAAFRPCAVYGPGDRELLPLFRWIGRGIAPVLGSEDARFSLLYIDDLAEAVLLWLQHGSCKASVFELHDGQPNGYSWKDVIDVSARLHARRVLHLKVPEPMLRLLAGLNFMAAKAMNYRPMLTPGKVREIRHANWVCDNTALNQEIGWRPQVSLEEGLRRTLR